MASETETPVEAPNLLPDGTELLEGAPGEGNDEEGSESTTDVSPEYVKRLRTEAAEARVKLQKLDEYEAKLFDAITATEAGKLLRDASDFIVTDRAALLGEDGYPDREKISAAVLELVEAKPYLARVAGDAGQGARPVPDEPISLGGLLRAAAS